MYKIKISKNRAKNPQRGRDRIIILDPNNPSYNTQIINSRVHNKSPLSIHPNTHPLQGTIYYYNTYFDN